jgi:hypothetical protein
MNDVPQAKLYDLLSRQGAELLREPGRLRLLLLEECSNFPEEVDVLVRALEYGLVSLVASGDEAERETFLRRFREEIENSRELALWAMDAWEKSPGIPCPVACLLGYGRDDATLGGCVRLCGNQGDGRTNRFCIFA